MNNKTSPSLIILKGGVLIQIQTCLHFNLQDFDLQEALSSF